MSYGQARPAAGLADPAIRRVTPVLSNFVILALTQTYIMDTICVFWDKHIVNKNESNIRETNNTRQPVVEQIVYL